MVRFLSLKAITSVILAAAMLASSPQSVVASHDTLYVADGVAVGLGTSCDSPNYNTGDYGTDDDALRAALSESLDNARIKTIFICAGTYVFDEPLDMSESVGVRRLELRGAGRDLTVLDGQEVTRFISAPMNVADEDYPCRSKGTFDVTLRDMTLEAFSSGPNWGGAIWYNGKLRMVNVLATGNVADPGGSVIDNNGGCADILIIEGSEFEDNSTDGSGNEGGTINMNGGIVRVRNSDFHGNTMDGEDSVGAVINAAIVDVSDSEFTSNLANDGYGGALFASDQLVVKGSEFTENVASKRGGAIAVSTSRAKILDSTFDGNSADDYGGAIATVWELNAGHIGDLAISRSTFNNNAALLGDGGAVSFRGNGFAGDISISESTFKNSYAGEEGGALYLYDARYAKVSGSTFGNPADNDDANEAGDRGGDIASNIGGGVNYVTRMDVLNSWFEAAYAHDAGGSMWLNCVRMRMSGVTVSDATSDGEGAGVIFGADGCLPEYEVVIKDSDFLENVTDDQGGAIANIQGAGANALKAIRISNVTFAENEADSGAAINIDGQRLVSITGSTFFENQTASGGGAIELCNTDLAVTSSTFERNDAGAEGGAILANCGTGNKISIVSSLFKENHTDANYGAASFGVYDTRLIGNDFINNTATLSGGAVGITVNTGDSDLYTFGRWKNNSFSGNSADVDGQHIVAFYDVGSLAPSTTDELLRLLTRGRGSVLFPGADWMVQY